MPSVTFHSVLFLTGLHLFFLGPWHGMQSQAKCHCVATVTVAGEIAFVTAAAYLVEGAEEANNTVKSKSHASVLTLEHNSVPYWLRLADDPGIYSLQDKTIHHVVWIWIYTPLLDVIFAIKGLWSPDLDRRGVIQKPAQTCQERLTECWVLVGTHCLFNQNLLLCALHFPKRGNVSRDSTTRFSFL